MKYVLAIGGMLLLSATHTTAQSPTSLPTDPPIYVWSGQPTGAGETSEESRADGSLPKDNGNAHFHFFGLKFKQTTGDTAPQRVSFEYDCYFNPPGSGEGKEERGVQNGQPCPAGRAPVSAFIIAFRIGLVGTDATKYELTYSCRLDSGTVQKKAGEYCGTPQFQGTAGVHAMTIQLKKK